MRVFDLDRHVILVEDNADDEALTRRALTKANIANKIIVARDGAGALKTIFDHTGYKNGANGYVRKPVNFADFAEAVRALGMFWLLLNEPVPQVTDHRAKGRQQ